MSHFFNVWWNRSTFPQVVGWFGLECFCTTPRSRSSVWKPLRVSRPARPPAKRVVKTMPLSDSTEAGMPWSATVCRNIATTAGPVDWAGDWLVAGDGEGVAGVVVEETQNLHISTAGAVGSGEPIVGEVGLPHLIR